MKRGKKTDGSHYKRWMDEWGDKSRSQEQGKRDVLRDTQLISSVCAPERSCRFVF